MALIVLDSEREGERRSEGQMAIHRALVDRRLKCGNEGSRLINCGERGLDIYNGKSIKKC